MPQAWICETSQSVPAEADLPGTEILAAERDLLLFAAFLREKARERFESAYSEADARLCERAERRAEQVRLFGQGIVDEIHVRD